MKILMALLLISATAMAQTLPKVEAPAELVSGDYTEGTMTRLSREEVADFIPWAQNAQNQLNRALKNAQSLPLRERLASIERAVKSVINKSSNKQYQMFMRYALNRGLLLASELQKNADMNQIGSKENALDILQRSIQVALDFYESDLNFQTRAANGNASVVLEYGKFGLSFFGHLYAGVINVWNPAAQYRLLYKLIEMANWDLSRDANALGQSDVIVEAYEMLQDLPEFPEAQAAANMRMLRRLHTLSIFNVSASSMGAVVVNSSVNTSSQRDGQTLPDKNNLVGESVFITYNSKYGKVVGKSSDGTYVVTYTDGTTTSGWGVDYIAVGRGCSKGICVGDRVFNTYNSSYADVSGILYNGQYSLRYSSSSSSGGWGLDYVAPLKGCYYGICTGNKVFNSYNSTTGIVKGILNGTQYIIEANGKTSGGWTKSYITKIE